MNESPEEIFPFPICELEICEHMSNEHCNLDHEVIVAIVNRGLLNSPRHHKNSHHIFKICPLFHEISH